MPGFDPGLLRWALANHTRRDGYWLALIHGRGDRRYDLDSQLVGSVTPEERAEAQQRLEASTQRGQAKAARMREHNEREEQRRQQCARARRHREAKAARKAEHERRQQEIAARKAALAAQGILVESRVVSRPHSPARRRTSRADAGSPRTHAGPAAAAGRVQEETPVRAAGREPAGLTRKPGHVTWFGAWPERSCHLQKWVQNYAQKGLQIERLSLSKKASHPSKPLSQMKMAELESRRTYCCEKSQCLLEKSHLTPCCRGRFAPATTGRWIDIRWLLGAKRHTTSG